MASIITFPLFSTVPKTVKKSRQKEGKSKQMKTERGKGGKEKRMYKDLSELETNSNWKVVDVVEMPSGGMTHNNNFQLPEEELKDIEVTIQFYREIGRTKLTDFIVRLKKKLQRGKRKPTLKDTSGGSRSSSSLVSADWSSQVRGGPVWLGSNMSIFLMFELVCFRMSQVHGSWRLWDSQFSQGGTSPSDSWGISV